MAKNCVKCGKKLGFFEVTPYDNRTFPDGNFKSKNPDLYCRECFRKEGAKYLNCEEKKEGKKSDIKNCEKCGKELEFAEGFASFYNLYTNGICRECGKKVIQSQARGYMNSQRLPDRIFTFGFQLIAYEKLKPLNRHMVNDVAIKVREAVNKEILSLPLPIAKQKDYEILVLAELLISNLNLRFGIRKEESDELDYFNKTGGFKE